MLEQGVDCNLYVSPCEDISEHTEFRLFVRKMNVVGASRYHYQSDAPEAKSSADFVRPALSEFAMRLLDALHIDTVVADVFIRDDSNDEPNVVLIELNPFVRETDPCLYSWEKTTD